MNPDRPATFASALMARAGRPEGAEIRFRCPAHAPDNHPSARWNPAKGVWTCDACRAGGGARDLAQRLGLTASAFPQATEPSRRPTTAQAVGTGDDHVRHSAVVRELWGKSSHIEGSLAERYLRSRGLSGELPPSLRYLPNAMHLPTRRYFPVLLAAVTRWPSDAPVAVHRTFIRRDGSGKADVDPPRKALGPLKGGAIRLAPPAAVLAVAEGIETGLSVQMATGIATWAAISAGNMPALVLPPLPLAAKIIIAADPDPIGLREAGKAAQGWLSEGRRVRVAVPHEGDFNDLLRSAQ